MISESVVVEEEIYLFHKVVCISACHCSDVNAECAVIIQKFAFCVFTVILVYLCNVCMNNMLTSY
ncbi:Protein of unknown function [Gryllus bimaculatus]|nr:Protein of unknown function [Gryllus bimaculatus]